jgi:site-specific recombinase XerD
MISTTVMSPSEGSEEKSKRDREQHFRNYHPDAQNGTSHHEKPDDALGHAVETWLLHSYPPVSSESTATIYRKLLISLRSYLQSQGLDLDSPRNQITQQIQTWANLRAPNSKHQVNVAPSTYNQRIAAIRSFYSWASKCGIYAWSDPTEKLSSTAVRKYAESHSLDVQEVCSQLKKIDRSTARGQRDYALLQVALNTGRSVHALASLTWGNISLHGENITLTFEKGRNGKVMYDTLDSRLSQTLLVYLHTIYGEDLTALSPQTPIWISFSDRTYRQAIGQQTIADICETHLGISKVHRLRHTFALTMDQLGAPVDTIQTRLGHESRATTNAYLAGLKGAHNPYATMLADVFGLDVQYPQAQN